MAGVACLAGASSVATAATHTLPAGLLAWPELWHIEVMRSKLIRSQKMARLGPLVVGMGLVLGLAIAHEEAGASSPQPPSPMVRILDRERGQKGAPPAGDPVTVVLSGNGRVRVQPPGVLWGGVGPTAPAASLGAEPSEVTACSCRGFRVRLSRVAGAVSALIIGLSLASLARSLARRR